MNEACLTYGRWQLYETNNHSNALPTQEPSCYLAAVPSRWPNWQDSLASAAPHFRLSSAPSRTRRACMAAAKKERVPWRPMPRVQDGHGNFADSLPRWPMPWPSKDAKSLREDGLWRVFHLTTGKRGAKGQRSKGTLPALPKIHRSCSEQHQHVGRGFRDTRDTKTDARVLVRRVAVEPARGA